MSQLNPPSANSSTDIGYVRRVKAKYEAELMARPHVVGIGIGLVPKHRSNRAGELTLVVNVDAEIGSELPTELDGVPVTVRNTGAFEAH